MTYKIKTKREHRALESQLRNTWCYRGTKTITDKDTMESIIIVATKSEADELHEVFAEQGYRFGYDKRIK